MPFVVAIDGVPDAPIDRNSAAFNLKHDDPLLRVDQYKSGLAVGLSAEPNTLPYQPQPINLPNHLSSWFQVAKFRLKSFSCVPFHTFRKMRLRYSSHTGTKQTVVKLIE